MTLYIKIFFRTVIDILIRLLFWPLFYLSSKYWGRKGLSSVHNVYFLVLSILSVNTKHNIYSAKQNIKTFLQINDKQKINDIAYKSNLLNSLEDEKISFYKVISKSYAHKKDIDKIQITSEGISMQDIVSLNLERKILFIHTHSSDRIASVESFLYKFSSMSEVDTNHLFIHRDFPKKTLDALKTLNIKNNKNLELSDLNVNSKDYKSSFIKKTKKANCIHLFFDLPLADSFDNFKYIKVPLFGREAIFIRGPIDISMLYNAVVIPVSLVNQVLKIKEPVYPENYIVNNKRDLSGMGVKLASNIEFLALKNPECWTVLNRLHLFFVRSKFK